MSPSAELELASPEPLSPELAPPEPLSAGASLPPLTATSSWSLDFPDDPPLSDFSSSDDCLSDEDDLSPLPLWLLELKTLEDSPVPDAELPVSSPSLLEEVIGRAVSATQSLNRKKR